MGLCGSVPTDQPSVAVRRSEAPLRSQSAAQQPQQTVRRDQPQSPQVWVGGASPSEQADHVAASGGGPAGGRGAPGGESGGLAAGGVSGVRTVDDAALWDSVGVRNAAPSTRSVVPTSLLSGHHSADIPRALQLGGPTPLGAHSRPHLSGAAGSAVAPPALAQYEAGAHPPGPLTHSERKSQTTSPPAAPSDVSLFLDDPAEELRGLPRFVPDQVPFSLADVRQGAGANAPLRAEDCYQYPNYRRFVRDASAYEAGSDSSRSSRSRAAAHSHTAPRRHTQRGRGELANDQSTTVSRSRNGPRSQNGPVVRVQSGGRPQRMPHSGSSGRLIELAEQQPRSQAQSRTQYGYLYNHSQSNQPSAALSSHYSGRHSHLSRAHTRTQASSSSYSARSLVARPRARPDTRRHLVGFSGGFEDSDCSSHDGDTPLSSLVAGSQRVGNGGDRNPLREYSAGWVGEADRQAGKPRVVSVNVHGYDEVEQQQ